MIKLIIFDWDDVFSLGSTEGYYDCYHQAMLGVGVYLPAKAEQKRIKAKWGTTHRMELEELLKEHPELVDKAVQIYEQHLFGDTFVSHLEPISGGKDLLLRLSSSYKLAVASGVDPGLLKEKILPRFGIPAEVFAQIMTSHDLDDPTYAKPHPHLAQAIMKAQGVNPEETIVVGDAPGDVRMAQAAGIEPVVVLTGHLTRPEAQKLGVRHIIPRVTELENILETHR